MVKPRILLVEDEFELRQLVAEALELMGYEVTTAPDGRDALSKLTTSRFDVMCTDAAMPNGVRGLDLCNHAAASFPQMGLVLASGFPRSEVGDLPDRTVFLPKPYRIRDLVEAIATAHPPARTVKANAKPR